MRALILAFIAIFAFTGAVSAQNDPLSTWDDFQSEVAEYEAFVDQWSIDFDEAATKDGFVLMWADILSRTIDHIATVQSIKWDECYKAYATAYVDKMLWIALYISGTYINATGPAIVPPSDQSAQVVYYVAYALGSAETSAREAVTCHTDIPATSPVAPEHRALTAAF